jgi:hypothetical protein
MPQRVFDPTGLVDVGARARAPRVRDLQGLRLAVIDNSKWNALRLLNAVVSRLSAEVPFAKVNRYKKETFTKPASAGLLREISANNDLALIAIGD